LEAHDVVQRQGSGSYRSARAADARGPCRTGNGRPRSSHAQPFLDEAAATAGHSLKLSVLDSEGCWSLAAAQGKRPYALVVTPGQRMPIHAGAAGKLLLAFEPPERQADWLSRPLTRFTSHTITDPKRLKAEAGRIRRQGWARDHGESAPCIHAYAAPVWASGGR
jgi:DNA-binding IclR family transcriptional regulator